MSRGTGLGPVGIIGIGAVGVAITALLVDAGIDVLGPRRGRVQAFIAAGGTVCDTNAEVAARVAALILLVQSDAALAQVMADIEPALKPGHVVLCLGTHPIAVKQQAARIAEGTGAVFLDGEVSGTPVMLRDRRGSLLLAGDEGAAERMREILEYVAPTVTFVGRFGNAFRIKLITNYLVAVHTLAAAEALVLGSRLGLDLGLVVSAVVPSAGGSTMLAVRGPMMAEGRFEDGSMTGIVRFFDLLREALSEGGHETGDLFALSESLYRRAVAEGHGSRDIAAVFESLNGTNREVAGNRER